MAASRSDYPLSTNISSPIPAASRRRVKQKSNAQPNPQLHNNGYSRDDFVVDDDTDGPLLETEDESEDGFGPIRDKGQPRNLSRRSLGPPITIDEKLQRLNKIHRLVVDDFLDAAKDLSQKVGSLRLQYQSVNGTEFC